MAFVGSVNKYRDTSQYAQGLQPLIQALMFKAQMQNQNQQQQLGGRELSQALQFNQGYGYEQADPNFVGPPRPIPEFQTPGAQNVLSQTLMPPRNTPYQQLAQERIDQWRKTGDDKFLGVGAAGSTKEINDTQVGGVEKLIERGIRGAENVSFWRHNFKEKEVKDAWNRTKRLTRFMGRPDGDKDLIFNSFKEQIEQWGGADELGWWDDEWFDSDLPTRGNGGSAQATSSRSPYQQYPDAFLEGGVWKVMQDGKKYRIEE